MKGRRGQRELLLRGVRGGGAEEVTPGGGEGRGGALGGRNLREHPITPGVQYGAHPEEATRCGA